MKEKPRASGAPPSALRAQCFVPTFNAGDTTRGVELARALVAAGAQRGRAVEVSFPAPRTQKPYYEGQITGAGFPVTRVDFDLDEAMVDAMIRADREAGELVPDAARAVALIAAILQHMREEKPDLVLYGFFPAAGIASQILGLPSVSFLPMPTHRPWLRRHFLKSIPDQLENGVTKRMGGPLRQMVARAVGGALWYTKFARQPTLAAAGRLHGWRPAAPDLFTMLSGTLHLVNDLPDFFDGQDVGDNCKITGPLFSRAAGAEVAAPIAEAFAPGRRNRVFVAMGSSGEKPYLMAAIEAVAAMDARAVVVVPPHIASLAEVRRAIPIPPSVYLTDAFVPAHQINPMADVAVIHGGQGTVQTAIHSGTPVVGVAMQPEQASNLDNVALRGAAIRIPRPFWTAAAVRRAVAAVLEERSYAEAAARLKRSLEGNDGRAEAGRALWALVEARGL